MDIWKKKCQHKKPHSDSE